MSFEKTQYSDQKLQYSHLCKALATERVYLVHIDVLVTHSTSLNASKISN